jgi:hypothetical protein
VTFATTEHNTIITQNQTMSALLRDIVWYQLVDATGELFDDSPSDGLGIAPDLMIIQLRDAILAKNKNTLDHVDAKNLKVFASLESLRQNSALRGSHIISTLPTSTEDNPLYIVVPSNTKKRKITQEFEYEEVPVTFQPQPLPVVVREGDVVTITRFEDGKERNLPLFIRQHLVDKLTEIKDKFESTDLVRLYCTGPPGCGKTCFFWMWAMMKMNEGKRLLFIEYRKLPLIWIFDGQQKQIKKLRTSPLLHESNLLEFVEQLVNQPPKRDFDFSILDGVQMNLRDDLDLVSLLQAATEAGKILKSVFVTSVQFHFPDGYEPRGVIFNVTWDMSFDSWTEADYDKAAESQLMQNEATRAKLLDTGDGRQDCMGRICSLYTLIIRQCVDATIHRQGLLFL